MASLPGTRDAARCGMSLMPGRRASRGQDAGDVLSHDASPPASSHANRARPPAPRAEAKVPHHTGHHPRAAARQLGRRVQDTLRHPARRITEPADGRPVLPLARAACTPPPCQARGGPASAGDPMLRAGSPITNGRERQQSAPQSRPDRRERASLRSRTDHTASAASGRRVPYRCSYALSRDSCGIFLVSFLGF